jgi:uncharacterized protein YggU (UPF0235/DUF167 family)
MTNKPSLPTQSRISVRVTPRAARNEAVAYENSLLTLRLTAPPVEGAANEACCTYIAALLGVAKSLVTVASGGRSRNKIIAVAGLSPDAIADRLTAALKRSR